MTQGKVQIHRTRIHARHINQCINRLVRLLIEQMIQAFEIRFRQFFTLLQALFTVPLRRQPTQRKKQRQHQQPFNFKIHIFTINLI